MSGRVSDPEKHSPILHPEPSVDVSADLDDGAKTGRDVPAGKLGRFLRNKRLLGKAGGRQILFQTPPPGFQFLILLLQLTPQRSQAQLGFDPRAQDSEIDRLRYKIICAGLRDLGLRFLRPRAPST